MKETADASTVVALVIMSITLLVGVIALLVGSWTMGFYCVLVATLFVQILFIKTP